MFDLHDFMVKNNVRSTMSEYEKAMLEELDRNIEDLIIEGRGSTLTNNFNMSAFDSLEDEYRTDSSTLFGDMFYIQSLQDESGDKIKEVLCNTVLNYGDSEHIACRVDKEFACALNALMPDAVFDFEYRNPEDLDAFHITYWRLEPKSTESIPSRFKALHAYERYLLDLRSKLYTEMDDSSVASILGLETNKGTEKYLSLLIPYAKQLTFKYVMGTILSKKDYNEFNI